MPQNRRQFLADVRRGMLIGSIGTETALDLGLTKSFADEPSSRLSSKRSNYLSP